MAVVLPHYKPVFKTIPYWLFKIFCFKKTQKLYCTITILFKGHRKKDSKCESEDCNDAGKCFKLLRIKFKIKYL